MVDFLTRLAERTLGLFPVVQPIITPMFAPGPARASDAQPDVVWEDEPSESVGNLSRTQETPAWEAPMMFSRPVLEPPPLVLSGDLSSVMPMEPSRTRPDTQPEPPRYAESGALEQVNAVPSQVMTRQRKDTNLRSEPLQDAQSEPRHLTLDTRRRKLLIRPQVAAYLEHPEPTLAERRVVLPESSASPPTIRVTIGRIEVKAMMPPAPPPAGPKPARPAPRLSLEEYLKQRNRGSR